MTTGTTHHPAKARLGAPAALILAFALAACTAHSGPIAAETRQAESGPAQADLAARQGVLEQLADRLETGYLFPQWGAAYAS